MLDMNLVALVEQFGGPDSEGLCRDYLESLRWPSRSIVCPRCSEQKISEIKERGQFHCLSCDYHFSVTAGTIFHDSHLPLWKWLLATYIMAESKKGISANQMKRTLNVSYKTAWYLCHRIRAAMAEANPSLLKGIVEADETYVGGKQRYVGRGNRDNKTMVLGAIERGGNVRLQVGSHATRQELHAFIRSTTDDTTEAIYTDDWRAYRGIGDANTRHETVNHSAEEWVRGDVHTNTVEGVWSLFKRSIVGSYHKVSVKHLDAYLQELEWRFNNRDNPFLFRETMRKLLQSEQLEYKSLTAKV